MSNNTQDAEGAGTKTAGGSLRDLLAAAYDAGFDASGEGWNAELPVNAIDTDSYRLRKREYLDGVATPAPAATPGVPDSVRALSEAATQGEWLYSPGANFDEADVTALVSGCRTEIGNFYPSDGLDEATALPGKANAAFAAAAVNHVRALIAAQTAGQSAGSGAETVAATLAEFQRQNGYHKREIEELLTEFGELLLSKVVPAPNSTRTGAAETEGCPIGYPPGECEWPVCGCARIVTAATRQPWPAGDDVAARLLIDAVGCEDLAPRASIERRFREAFAEAAISYRQGAKRIRELEAALAARPEAPSDAGWSREEQRND